jgi:medium-chain acyl-[acyl-carrier-protein] hydrolase
MNSRERFDTTFTIASYEADVTGRLSLFALFNRFQELAGNHAAFLQVGYDELQQSHLAWILSRIKVQLIRLPDWGDTVHLTTWPKGIDRLFALRDFSMHSETGEPLALATTAWLLVDLTKNRPQRIENLPIDLRFPGAPHAIEQTPDKIQLPVDMATAFEKQIWLSDLDINRHVNNAQYAKWIDDCFSAEPFRNRTKKSLQINYLEETPLGDTITVMKTPQDDHAPEYFIVGRSRQKSSTVFQASMTWM